MKITYSDKSTYQKQPAIADNEKITASDMNEIKQVVNSNYDELTGIISSGDGYIKFSEGTLICYGNYGSISIPTSHQEIATVNLPQEFTNNDYSISVQFTGNGKYWTWVATSIDERNTTNFKIAYWNNSTVSQATIPNSLWIAIGKWK